ncbi:hypothetical protein AEA09_16390 [Lysinibacillus contaminans]|uniref:PepSY domain-containing protein n=1 Tax=Lysinibacillus contaminans TaxID=1293441 RepID=A0ABR5JVY8_9BACI|nr:PepSY domain-containing protein [Lysinibacillus contaminans]KOS66330.1 hypothetical protein AEA09_16390 [Lysinibacillus contaminans]
MKKWLIPIIVIVISCAVALWFLQNRFFNAEPISEKEAIAHIESVYSGRVEHIEKNDHFYKIQLTRNGATYNVEINANTRQITDLTLKEGATTPLLTEAQVRKVVGDYMPGEIESVTLKDTYYDVKVESENIIKSLKIDLYTGEVLSETETIKEADKPSNVEAVISEQQAIQIALQELKGEVDSVDYEETTDGGYYLVEIESDNNEAIFQIHGVSGKVLSVTLE